ncbi:alpha beta-hydrolase, partial [Pseudomassariella vexata]
KPTIRFIHGGWHTPSLFQRMRDLCESHGFPTECPLLPSIDALPPVGMVEDAQMIRELLRKFVEEETRDVLIVGHSYGGNVMTEAARVELAKARREEKGQRGGVVELLYLATFLMAPGESLQSSSGGKLPWFLSIDEQGRTHMSEPERLLFNDLPKDEQDHWVAEMKGHSVNGSVPITHAGYLYHPATYLFTENDQAIPVQAQKMVVDKVSEKKGYCSSGHSPYLSQPQVVLDVIRKITGHSDG